MPPPLGKYELLLGLGETIREKGKGQMRKGREKEGKGKR